VRVADPQIRSGFFWLPSDPGKQLPGTLEISDEGRIDLKILGTAGEPSRLFSDHATIPRIVGLVEKGGFVTLDQCFFTARTFEGSGIAKGRIFAHQAFLGVLFSEGEPVRFSEFQFSVEGLDEWLLLSGITSTADWAASTISIDYVRPDDVALALPDGRRLAFSHAWSFAPDFNKAGVTQKASIRVSADELLSFEEATAIAHRVTNFLCFAIDRTVTIDAFSATVMASEDGAGPEKPTQIKVFYQSLPFSDRAPKIDRFRMLFGYSHIAGSAEEKLRRWFAAYESFRPALALYFGARAGAHRYLNGRFLSLVQALETYHRRTSDERLMDEDLFRELLADLKEACPKEHRSWLARRLEYGNEVSLAARLKHIVKPFEAQIGDSKERKKLIRKIVDTRNFLTHYDRKLESKAADGAQLHALCVIAEAILQLHFLKELGFTDDEIELIIAKSDTLQAKLKGKPV
jgi:hypothetical protein